MRDITLYKNCLGSYFSKPLSPNINNLLLSIKLSLLIIKSGTDKNIIIKLKLNNFLLGLINIFNSEFFDKFINFRANIENAHHKSIKALGISLNKFEVL